jgi:hypothetical protein
MQARLEELQAEVKYLRDFADAVERGEHDDEEAIAAAVARLLPMEPERGRFGRTKPVQDTRPELARKAQRLSKQSQVYDRINKELYPEIKNLQFRLSVE